MKVTLTLTRLRVINRARRWPFQGMFTALLNGRVNCLYRPCNAETGYTKRLKRHLAITEGGPILA